MNRGSVSRAAAACDLGGIRQSWPNRYSVTIMTALFVALTIVVLIGLSGTAAADTRNLTSTADTQIVENSSTANYGGATTLKVDGDNPDGSGKDVSSLLRWDLSSVPAGSKVDSASVTVNVTNSSSQTYQVYDLKRPWVGSAATWQQYASGSTWEVAGAKGSLDRGSQVGSLSATTTGTRSFTLSPALVQRWLDNPASNQGIIIANATNTDGIDFYSREADDASFRPSLNVNYTATPTGTCNKGQALAQYRNESKTFNTQPVLTRCEGAINNDWGSGSPGSGVNADTFTTRWVGTFDFEASDYEFTATADDGVRVWVDGQPLIDQWKDQAATTYKATRTLTAGDHEVKVEYYENLGAAVAKVSWAKVGQPSPADTDGDGVTDDVDQCDNTVGPASNNGCPVSQPPASKKIVAAHWFVETQHAVEGANTVSAYESEIAKAKAMGVDAFAYNIISVDSYMGLVDTLYTAANNWNVAHPDDKFYLFPSADQCCSMSETNLDKLMLAHYNDPARLRVDGGRFGNNLPVAQTWHGESKGPAEWNRIQSEWRSAGKPMFFIPYFDHNAYGSSFSNLIDTYNGANNSDPSDDTVDGMFYFGGWASGDNPYRGVQQDDALKAAVDASPGMDAMYGCGPEFNTHRGPASNENRMLGDHEGFNTWINCLNNLATDSPRFVEFNTWNDYGEGTHLGGPYPRSQLSPDFWGNDVNHDAFRAIGEYYTKWYHTGVKPEITNDLIAIAHRPHPENVAGINANGSGIADDTDNARVWQGNIRPLVRQGNYSVVEDRLYAAVFLTKPAEIKLISGSTSQTFSAGAGVTQVSMPFADGTQRIQLLRSGSVVLTATSDMQISSAPTSLFNYNSNTAYAEGP
jgi:hypothetical protein